MNFLTYSGKKVQIVMNNGFTYVGVVIDSDSNSIKIIDKYNHNVVLKEDSIQLIKELKWFQKKKYLQIF